MRSFLAIALLALLGCNEVTPATDEEQKQGLLAEVTSVGTGVFVVRDNVKGVTCYVYSKGGISCMRSVADGGAHICEPGDVHVATLPPPSDKVIWDVRACARISGNVYGWTTVKAEGWFPGSDYEARGYRLDDGFDFKRKAR